MKPEHMELVRRVHKFLYLVIALEEYGLRVPLDSLEVLIEQVQRLEAALCVEVVEARKEETE